MHKVAAKTPETKQTDKWRRGQETQGNGEQINTIGVERLIRYGEKHNRE